MARPEVSLSHRKVIPLDGRDEGRLVSNPPDVTSPVQKVFELTKEKKPSSRFLWADEDEQPFSYRRVLVTQPLTPFFRTSIGGCRVGGGGTSREALRRAKRKSKEKFERQEPLNQD